MAGGGGGGVGGEGRKLYCLCHLLLKSTMHTLSMHNNMFDCTFNILCFFFGVLNKVYIMVGGRGDY